MDWCAKATKLQVRTNADNPEQTANAVAFGASGIGLCRTEHMFFEGNRIDAMREMILADTVEDRKQALAKILPYQKSDFAGMFKELKGLPATIRSSTRPSTNSCRTRNPRRKISPPKWRVRRENPTARQRAA